MPEETKSAPTQKTIEVWQALKQHATEFRNIEEEALKIHKGEEASLRKISNIQQSMQMGFIDRIKQEKNLRNDILNLDKDIIETRQKYVLMEEGEEKNRMRQFLSSLHQQKLAKEELLKFLGEWGMVLYVTRRVWEVFKALDVAAYEFRKEVGMTREQSKALKDMTWQVTTQYMHLGVIAQMVNKAIETAGHYMGGMHNVSKEVATTLSIINAQLGTAIEDTAKMMRNFAVFAGSTIDAQTNMVYFTQALSSAAGVSFNEIAKDIAGMSDTTLRMVSRMPNVIAKTSVELRKMGTDINKAAESSAKLLNFTENIQAEMEASVLLGHSINLQKARELAYHRDLEGSTREILNLAKQNNFAHGMDTFQMEAFARATGKSVEEILNMVQADEEMNKALHSGNDQIRKAAEEYKRLREMNEANAKATGKDIEYQMKLKANQERIAAINQKIAQIWAEISYPLLKILDISLALVVPAIDIGKGIFLWVTGIKLAVLGMKGFLISLGSVTKLARYIGDIFMSLFPHRGDFPILLKLSRGFESIALGAKEIKLSFLRIGSTIGHIFEPIATKAMFVYNKIAAFGGLGAKLGGIGAKFGGMFNFMRPLLNMVSRFLGPIGMIITAIQFLYNLVHRLHGIGEVYSRGGLWKAIIYGLKAVGGAIYDTLLKPFVSAYQWIMSFFGGKSPSKIALSIVKGVVSIQAMLFDAITYPWRHAAAWIFKKIPFMSKFANKLEGGAGGMLSSIEHKSNASYVPAVTVTPNGTTVAGGAASSAAASTTGTAAATSKYTLDDVYCIMKELNDNLLAGKVKSGDVYLDSSLVSSQLSRGISFKGGYGTNK